MSQYWIIMLCSWFGTVSLQYIHSGRPGADSIMDPLEPTLRYPLPYINYFHLPTSRNDYEMYQNDPVNPDNYNQFYHDDKEAVQLPDLLRKRRTIDDIRTKETMDKQWIPNLIDTDKTTYLQNDERLTATPFVFHGYSGVVENNGSELHNLEMVEKKSFSPWGGKRDSTHFENMWSWKRTAGIREPSMPKRVRFSPWGGKRSGQLIYKPGGKSSKIIFSTSVPDLTRVISNYSPKDKQFNFAGIHLVPAVDKRNPVKILALSTSLNDNFMRDALPYSDFSETIPKLFKPGHLYSDVNLKKDGKRKVKFSAWGGKRSPPIIGPIWTPSPNSIKDNTLEAILLIRNSQDSNDKVYKTS